MSSKPERPFAIIGQGTIFDGIAYWATLVGVYVMVGGLMFYSGKGKLFDDDGNAPQGIKEQFEGTFLDTFPGTDAAWVILGILEFAVFVLNVLAFILAHELSHLALTAGTPIRVEIGLLVADLETTERLLGRALREVGLQLHFERGGRLAYGSL